MLFRSLVRARPALPEATALPDKLRPDIRQSRGIESTPNRLLATAAQAIADLARDIPQQIARRHFSLNARTRVRDLSLSD